MPSGKKAVFRSVAAPLIPIPLLKSPHGTPSNMTDLKVFASYLLTNAPQHFKKFRLKKFGVLEDNLVQNLLQTALFPLKTLLKAPNIASKNGWGSVALEHGKRCKVFHVSPSSITNNTTALCNATP